MTHVFEEDAELGVALWVVGGFEERQEQVVEELLEALHQPVRVVHVKEAWHLHHPTNVVGVCAVRDCPVRKLVPLIARATVHRQPQLGVLIFALLQVVHYFLKSNQSLSNYNHVSFT